MLSIQAAHDAARYEYNWGYSTVPQRLFGPQSGSPADVTALERSWAPIPARRDTTADIDSWDTDLVLLATVPDSSNVGETARHASRLLDAFSTGATPPVAGSLSTTQQRLLSAALTSILAITPARRVGTAAQTDPTPSSVDDASQTDPLPHPVDLTTRPDATCVVCLARVVNTVLVPCWHMALCVVCISLRDRVVPRVLLIRVFLLGVLFRVED